MKKILFCFALLLGCISSFADECYISDSTFNKAIKEGDVEFVQSHVKKVKNIDSEECFLCTASQHKQDKILDILLENKANPDCPDSTILPLYTALIYKNDYAVDKLLDAGADPNKKNIVPLICYAVAEEMPHATAKLLEAGAKTDVTFMKVTPYQLAFMDDNYEVQKAIIDFNNKRFKTPSASINNAIKLLEKSNYGNQFYKIIMGENKYKQPYNITFADLTFFGNVMENYKATHITRVQKGVPCIFINNLYRGESDYFLASILASSLVTVGEKRSKIGELVTTAVAFGVWKDLKSDKNFPESTSISAKSFDLYTEMLDKAEWDFNSLWRLEKLFEGMPMKSKGFKNIDLNSYYPFANS